MENGNGLPAVPCELQDLLDIWDGNILSAKEQFALVRQMMGTVNLIFRLSKLFLTAGLEIA